MQVARTISDVRAAVEAARATGQTVGCVPTMGALHEGHLSLVRRAGGECDYVIVTIFVNPTQFAPGEDLESYPKPETTDLELAEREGVDLAFIPTPDDMYPEGARTTVHVADLTDGMCGPHRPGHFDGVATVVAKLLNITTPTRAYFGEKDYQQLQVIRRLARDLDMPVEIIGCSTVREPDGLAMSSRNAYLSAEDREIAPKLNAALRIGAEVIARGGTASEAESAAVAALASEPRFLIQYIEARRPDTLRRDEIPGPPMVIAAAAYLGETRLIDNVVVDGEHA
ncbi:MAG TPA: pantoate--beta-alanine ligase [Armatimonadota bacterium]|nr:pantoate--beta-alanine ligase [Armatimonadota bacterium]